jgi:hypothetical protein
MTTKLADRVAELEREVADLKQAVHAKSANVNAPGPDDWKSTIGVFKDDPFYDDMVRLGRAYRRRQPKC